jgi:hypothetical protein
MFSILRPPYNRGNERDNYRGDRSSFSDERRNRDRRDDGIIYNFLDNFNPYFVI